MKQLIYIALLLIGFQANALTSDDSTATVQSQHSKRTISGGTTKKEMGVRVWMKSTNNKVIAIKCKKNPNVICAYTAKADDSDEGIDETLCPTTSATHISNPFYSQQFPNAQKCYLGIPQVNGGVVYYEVNTISYECSQSDEYNATIHFTPELDLE
ncbi:MAG: hypothetical protein P0Y49_09290 [Candidatus Pedobacter colombiensis]|uniref:Uncharacterized protein n=1 Tax=Candidatus Pedobacter colombiensis TaxID=3121371 RepID=A0AAJ6B8X3_9SPHI|nr:hypothetical protein [Pedobacter sp.]WEK21334.1 MAG: hypothetical protein P0Y49_09290 [Pedobacter sp.]